VRKSTLLTIRELLRKDTEGLTVAQMAELTKAPQNSVQRALKAMPDAYIDRWTSTGRQRYYRAVWCVVVPPENCPKP